MKVHMLALFESFFALINGLKMSGESDRGDFRRDEIGGQEHEKVGVVEVLAVAGSNGVS